MRLLGLDDSQVKRILLKEAKERRAAWARAHEFFEAYDRLYFFEHYDKKSPMNLMGKDGIEVEVNDATNIVDLTMGLLSNVEIDIHAIPLLSEEENIRDSSEVEAWLWGILNTNAEDQGQPPQNSALFDAVRLGMGVLFTYFDSDKGCPFVIKALDPYTVYPESGGPKGQWRSVLIVEKKSLTDLEEEWGATIDVSPDASYEKRESKKLEEIDYWGYEYVDEELAQRLTPEEEPLPQIPPFLMGVNEGIPGGGAEMPEVGMGQIPPLFDEGLPQGLQPGWHVVNCVIAGKHVLRPPTIMQGYEEIPLTIFGSKPTGGRAGGEERPEYLFLSSLFPVHKAILLSDANMSAQQKQITLYTNLPAVHKAGRLGASNINWDNKLGNIITLTQPDEEFGFPTWRGNPPDVWAVDNFYKKQIQEGSFSAVALGAQEAMSGYAYSQLWQANLTRLAQPRQSFGLAMKDVFRKIQSYAVNLVPDQPMTLLCRYKKITGRMIEMAGRELQPYIIDTELSPELPTDRARNIAMGIQLAQLGPNCPFSKRGLAERFFDIQQPEEEENLKMQEMIRDNKVVQAMQLQDAWLQQTGEKIPLEVLLSGDTNVISRLQRAIGQQPGGVSSQIAPAEEIGYAQQQPPPTGPEGRL